MIQKNITITIISKRYYFAYNTEGFIIKPTKVESGSSVLFNKINLNDIAIECDTLSELNAELKLRGLNYDLNNIESINPITNWHISDNRNIRVFMSYKQYTALLADTRLINDTPLGILMLTKLHNLNIPIIDDDSGYYIYLEKLDDCDKDIFKEFGAKIQILNLNEITEIN